MVDIVICVLKISQVLTWIQMLLLQKVCHRRVLNHKKVVHQHRTNYTLSNTHKLLLKVP